MKVEGQFDFSNGGIINSNIEKERIESVNCTRIYLVKGFTV